MPFAGFKGATESDSSVFWGLGGEGKGLWDEKKGEDRKRGTDGCQQKLEPKAGDKLCFFESLDTERCYCHSDNCLEYRVNGDSGEAREKGILLFFGQPDVLGRTRGWWRGCGQQVVFVSPSFPSLLCSEVSLS